VSTSRITVSVGNSTVPTRPDPLRCMAVPSLLVIAAVVFGAAAGAFLPRPAHRLAVPFGSPPRTSCALCARPFPPGSPGFVRAGPACPCAKTPWPAAVITTATATAAGLLAATVGPTPLLPLLLLATVLATLLATIDLSCLRLPDPLVATLAALLIIPLTFAGAPPRAFVAAGVVGLAYLLIALLPGAGLGLGDVKLAAVLSFPLGFIGWQAVVIGVIAPHLINGPIALVLLARRRANRRTPVPFGPSLLLGALAAIALTA
jgi:leader peptidase (prepilin peptidase)/N-methyltransferase